MANYRTIRELKPYRGVNLFRLHKDGSFYYYAFEDDDQITTRSLKELKRKVDERLGKNPQKIKVTLVRFYRGSYEFVLSHDEYREIMDHPFGDAEDKLVGKLQDMMDRDEIKYCKADYMLEVNGEMCEHFTDDFLDEIKFDIEELAKRNSENF